ncbi:MAG: malectin domain-containing carbohydrate-binding protein, partial [Limimaricola soesokkakensis]|uniref:malectin domain-containing carbohydrate-binding protein n=1 Tax=Limimaricola soesokkakensis TaxID=1343159 RepID=UPI0040594418
KITLLYTENWPGAFNLPSSDRIFDVTVDGTAFAEFADLNPLVEAAAALGQALPPSSATNAQKQPFLGTVLTRELIYTAVDDQLNLAFIHNNQNPKINAIQISQLGGPRVADGTAPVIESVSIENLQGDTDSPREITVVLSDNKGFDAASLVTDGSELVFSGIVPTAVSAPSVVLTNGGMTATLTYVAQPPASGSWPSGEGQISIAAGVFADAAGNSAAGATSSFILEPNLDNLVRGSVVRAINVGTTDTSPATNLGPDPLEGGAVDNNRYGGAIAADSLLLDATGQPIAFEADDNAYYTSPKGQGPLNANVDGQSGTTGSNSGGIDLDGSALHTYRDSQADIWTATYSGFANGSYVVELHFAELFHSAAGGRVGDFTINGTLVGDDYDAFVAGGGADRPSVIRHNVLVTDGTITVQVDSSSGQAGYSAIVVYDAVPSDLPPTISVSAGSAVEGEDAVITVTRMGDLSEAVTVTLSLTDVSTTSADRGPLAATTVVIPAGQTSASTTVPIIDDDLEEPAESFTVSITGVSNAGNDAVIATGGGTTTVTIAASDVAPTPAIVLPIDFNASPLLSYSNQDQTPQGFQIDPDGAGITLSGNTWKKTLLPGGTFTVGADTVLRFDVTMQNGTAEFVSIGLENDNNYKTTDDLLFQVFGSVNIARFDQSVRNDYTTVGQTVSYEISLAAHAGRTFDYLALINDDDAAQSSIVRFSNVELVQGGGASGNTQPPHIVGDALPDVTATEDMPLEVSLPFEDPDTAYDQLSFSFQGLPDFLSLSGGLLVGTPGNEHVGVHTIEVTATDPEGNAAIGQFDLTVENVNDAPIVTGSIPNTTAPLNQAFNMALPAGLFTDIDPNDTLTYRAEGLPAGLSIDPATGTISGTPQQNSNYTVTVFATDTAQAETSASFVLQVDEVTLPEPILIEVENFTGLTEANSDLVNFRTEFAAPASGSTVVKVGAGQQGVISTSLAGFGVVAGTYDLEIGYFDENDGESQVDVLLQLADGTQTLIGSFTMNQVLAGQGNALQAANLTSVTLSGVQIPDGARLVLSGTSDAREHLRFDKVVFNPVPNAQPQFESAAAQEVLENTVIAGDVDAADPEGAVVSYAIVGGADMDKLSIDPDTGVLSFVTAADFEAPGDADQNNVYEVTVEASDGVARALQNVTITVLDAEEGLAINSPASATVAENQTVVTTVVATEDGGTAPITYAIGTAGADGSLFTIDPATGALSFIAAPDFESPGDAGADNVYDVEVIASNGSNEVAQLMSVMVTDVDENGGMPEAILRINAWGGEVAATDGGPNWLADGNNNPNSPYVLTATGAGNNRGDTQGFGGDTTNVPSHVPQTVLGTARSANSPFSYAIPVTDLIGNGDYIVNLYLAELSAANQLPGRRIFDISVEGQTEGMLDNFDPSLPSGGGDLRILSYEVKVTDGELNIGFLHDLVDGRNNPIINAIEILSNPVPAFDTDAPVAALTLNNPATATDPILVEVALSDASGIDATTLGDDDLTLSVDGVEASNPGITFIGFAGGVARYEIAAPQGGWTNGTQIGVALVAGAVSDRANTPNVNEATSAALDLEIGAGGTVVYRINTGGAQVAATDGGPIWTGDQPGNGSPYLRLTTLRDDADTGGKAAPGIDGVPNAIFSTARSSDGSFFYDIPVSALGGGQNYEVRLYLAEISPTGQAGNFRNFDASLEGFVPATFDNLDPGALYGTGGGVLTARVNVDDGVLNIGLVKDLKQNPIINGIEIVALSEEVENPPIPIVPTNALQAFAAQGDLDTSQSYASGTVGSAKLGIMLGNANIEASNFGLNSFKVTNTGDKKISAIFIDVSSALYPDSVFDPDGAGGDSATKPWAVNAAGNTGAYIGGGVGGYFLPGPDPLPNTTGTGKPSNGGYKGAMVKFDPNVSGGFGKNEIVGFSGDMDPNSIAGLTKSSLDALAVDGWDVGGISGHELIGSTFTVLFDDGTTASGQLGSDGSASGSHAIATQTGAGAVAPTLTVNGVGAGGTGTYGGSQPSVIVSGTPGDTVMVTLTKGFNPVQGAGDIPALVENRLDAYAFKANNTFDNQHVVVKLNSSGIADLSHRFDYDDSPANNKADGTFPGDDVSPIGFVAAVVDPANGNAPISPITKPIYLTNQGGPVSGDPSSGQEGYFQIVNSGADGYFKIQIEDENGTGGSTPGGKWTYHTAPDAAGRQANFQGNGYYLFGSNTSTAIDNNVNGADRLEYTIYVPETDLGTYKINFAVSRDGLAAGDQQNDLWLNFKPAGQAGNGDILSYMPANARPEPHLDGFVKIYGGSNNGNWSQAFRIDGQPNYNASVTITEAGLYTVQVDGRSQGYHVDYFELYKGSDPASSAVNSAFVAGNPGTGGGNGGSDGGGSTGGDIFGTIVTPIAASSDDWEQFGGGGSKDLEFGLNGSQPQAVGMRFEGIDIPQTAIITDAYLQFTAFGTSSGAASFTIGIQGSESTATFSSSAPPQSRVIVDEFAWSNVEQWTAGGTYRTPDISELIETVIGADGASNAALAFIVAGSGSRVASSFNNGDAPELVLVLDDGSTLTM